MISIEAIVVAELANSAETVAMKEMPAKIKIIAMAMMYPSI
jgi:hypothetical protein